MLLSFAWRCATAQSQLCSPGILPSANAVEDQFVTGVSQPDSPAETRGCPLFDIRQSDFKFRIESLMAILRDSRHEGWVLAAYPDPKTKRPLIGAGFSLDVAAVDHPQHDPLNPHSFLEPSSAQLWQAAGLRVERLQQILAKFDRTQKAAPARGRRHKVKLRALRPQLNEEEATRLLRISSMQAAYNARAYCRGFDQLTASQQMALSQLVFQMGVNLEQFVQFLGELNADFTTSDLSNLDQPAESPERWNGEHWRLVESALMDSQWARVYSGRASTVIAMFDPAYGSDAGAAQDRIEASLRPAVAHSPGRRSPTALRTVALNRRPAKPGRAGISSAGGRHRRRLT